MTNRLTDRKIEITDNINNRKLIFERSKKGFTIVELMVVMLIIGLGLMSFTPKLLTPTSLAEDDRLMFFDKLIEEHYERAIELGRPTYFTGFKGSANIQTYDGKAVTIPNVKSIQEAKVNGYLTRGLEYGVRVYPDGFVDHFEIIDTEDIIIESVPLLMITKYDDTRDEL